jgi:hypothetical protein
MIRLSMAAAPMRPSGTGSSPFEEIPPEASKPQDVRDVRGLVGFGVRNQIGHEQSNRDVTAKSIRQML